MQAGTQQEDGGVSLVLKRVVGVGVGLVYILGHIKDDIMNLREHYVIPSPTPTTPFKTTPLLLL